MGGLRYLSKGSTKSVMPRKIFSTGRTSQPIETKSVGLMPKGTWTIMVRERNSSGNENAKNYRKIKGSCPEKNCRCGYMELRE